MQRYKSGTVSKVSLTVMLQAIYSYSNRASINRRNLEDKVKDTDEQKQNTKWTVCSMKLTIFPHFNRLTNERKDTFYTFLHTSESLLIIEVIFFFPWKTNFLKEQLLLIIN